MARGGKRKRQESTRYDATRPCCMHIVDQYDEKTSDLTPKRWYTFREIAKEYIAMETKEGELVMPILDMLNEEYHELEYIPHYHPTCYRRYTDKKRLCNARKRFKKNKLANSSTDSAGVHTSLVLPAVCLICKKKDNYVYIRGRRMRDRLYTAETDTCGQLCYAAQLKHDQSILKHIEGKDAAALEAKYHAVCYKNYIRFLKGDGREKERGENSPFDAGYKIFCDSVIVKKILEKKEIFRMDSLLRMFKKILRKRVSVDASEYGFDELKSMIHNDFPQITFHRPSTKRKYELVYVETHSTETSTFEEVESSSESEPETSKIGNHQEHVPSRHNKGPISLLNALYSAGNFIRSALEQQPGIESTWPPTSKAFTLNNIQTVVPQVLYNFLAWVVGASEDPTLEKLQDVSGQTELKLLSLCQDIVHLASDGEKQTPKSLALGLTVRHLTDSSQILKILNQLGHIASLDTIINFENSLAQLQLQQENIIFKDFNEKVPTVFIWDIDFEKETISGIGTTHSNGIMVQSATAVSSVEQNCPHTSQTQSDLLPKPMMIDNECQNGVGSKIPSVHAEMDVDNRLLGEAKRLDDLYNIIKCTSAREKDYSTPGWTGFHISVDTVVLPKSEIYYLPVIETSQSEMTTVRTVFKQTLDMADRLKLQTVMVVFDQETYAKAQHIRWNDCNLTKRTVVRLGEHHIMTSFLGIIGERYQDAGLREILVESGLVGPCSIDGVLSGHYSHSIRTHQLIYEAMQQLRLAMFLDSLSQDKAEMYESVALELLDQFRSGCVLDSMESVATKEMLEDYSLYIENESCANPTFKLWSSYIDMVQLLLSFIRATRTSNWKLHLAATRKMMPWFFAYNRVNYARNLLVYWTEMSKLPSTHPDCHQMITDTGNWTVQHQGTESFSSLACDQAIRQTLDREGMTFRQGSVQRWTPAQPEEVAIRRQCKMMAGLDHECGTLREFDQRNIKRDEEAVLSVINTVQNMINPFSDHDELVSLSSGVPAESEVKDDLLDAEKKGESAADSYIKECLIKQGRDMFSFIPSMKLKTFSDQFKIKRSLTGQDIAQTDESALFPRLRSICQNRDIDLREILSHSLGNVSFPLANVSGTHAHTTKSDMMKLLESREPDCTVESVPPGNAIMIDGIAVIQSLKKPIPSTFGELADLVLSIVVSLARKYKSSRVDFITGHYSDVRIKNSERITTSKDEDQIIQICGKDQRIPSQWKTFLSHNSNKENLMKFLCSCWISALFENVPESLEIYLAYNSLCQVVRIENGQSSVEDVVELECDHEEPGTRILLHAKHASSSHPHVILKSPDPDVAVMALTHSTSVHTNMYFLSGTTNKPRIINLQMIADTLSSESCRSLVGLHVFTGCDSVSSFHGKGKEKAFNTAMSDNKFIKAFCDLGSSFDLDDTTLSTLERFVCKLYGQNCSSVNEARYIVFRVKENSTAKCLPPTADALKLHTLRANYQTGIYRRALQPKMCAPSPDGHGWKIREKLLSVQWMTQAPAPKELLKLISCECETGECATKSCFCKSLNIN